MFSRVEPFVHFLFIFFFVIGCQEEQFCEIILNLDQWLRRRCHLKYFFIWSSGSLHVPWRGSICAILKEGIMGNIHVKLYEIWTSGLGGDVN